MVEMEKLYLEVLETTDGQILVSHLYQFNRYYELLNKITEELRKLGHLQTNIFRNAFENMYIKNQAIIGASFHLNSEINYDEVEKAINDIWVNDGQNWSDRIWNDKAKLTEELREGLIDCLATGASPDKLTKRIMDSFGVSFHNAQTLARTELAHIQNASTINKYKKIGITKVKVLVDTNCCEECTELKNTEFPIDQVPILPVHPNCKCTYMAVI